MIVTEDRAGQSRSARKQWVHTRPFWGCVFIMLSGLEIYGLTVNRGEITAVHGTAGAAGLIIGGVMVVLGLVCLIQPTQHLVVGALCLVAALAALPLSNFGGFLIGTLLGVHGSALVLSFKPAKELAK